MITVLTLALSLLWVSLAQAQQLAFPSAEGFGRLSAGGRGGYVCHVNSLADTSTGSIIGDGPHYQGTFRYCAVTRTGARTIVFDTSGTISLITGGRLIIENNPNLTIAGQTAPGNGIQLKDAGLFFRSSHTIVRYIKSRPGPVVALADVTDTLAIEGSPQHVIADHMSGQWSVDELASIWSAARDITIQWSLFGWGLHCATHGSGCHSRGVNMGSAATNYSFLHNLVAHNTDRHPYVIGGDGEFVNNVFYDYGSPGVWEAYDNVVRQNVIANYYKPGPFTPLPYREPIVRRCGLCGFNTGSGIWVDNNIDTVFRTSDTQPDTDSVRTGGNAPYLALAGSAYNYPSISPGMASETDAFTAYNDVLAKSGARIPWYDTTDQQLVSTVLNTTGFRINDPSEVGGWPSISVVTRGAGYDTDRDGMPDAWETACSSAVNTASTNHTGLSNSDEDDGALIVSTTGYSALEHYLNEEAGDYAPDSCGGLATAPDTTDPTNVVITAPTEDATVSGASVTFSATAQDETALGTATFYQNGASIATDPSGSPYSITWDTTLIPDGDKVLTVEVCDTSNNCTLSPTPVNVIVANGSGYTAIHTASAPTVDGTLTEFAGANSVSLTGTTNSTDLRLMWDSDNLYLGAITQDTALETVQTAHDAPTIYNDDAIEIVIDTDNDGVYDTTDYKFIVNAAEITYDASGPSFTLSYEPTYPAPQVVIVGTLNSAGADTSWAIEIALPWSILGITPAADNVYGINVQMDDRDSGVRTTYRWNGSINNIADAVDVTLGPESGGGDTTPPFNVAITDPLDAQHIGGTYTIMATAQDDTSIQDVRFYLDTSTLLCTDTSAPYTCDLDTTQETETTHTLKVNARDDASPTPNNTDSATITVTVDNTAPSAPTNLTLNASYDEGEFLIFANWDDATGVASYRIERCEGVDCSSFAQIDTSLTSDYLDPLLPEGTTYCYKVRSVDAAQNPSAAYSSPVCIKTLFVADSPGSPTGATTTTAGTPAFPGRPTSPSTTTAGTVALPGQPTSPSTTTSATPTFPGVPTLP
jgi:hypothetical protein